MLSAEEFRRGLSFSESLIRCTQSADGRDNYPFLLHTHLPRISKAEIDYHTSSLSYSRQPVDACTEMAQLPVCRERKDILPNFILLLRYRTPLCHGLREGERWAL